MKHQLQTIRAGLETATCYPMMGVDAHSVQTAITALSELERMAGEPVAWKHDCAALLANDVELRIDNCPHCGRPRAAPVAQQDEHLTITWDEQQTRILAVTMQDEDGRILKVLAEAPATAQKAAAAQGFRDGAASVTQQEPVGYLHPQAKQRLENGETVAFRKTPYAGEPTLAVYVGAAPPAQPHVPEADCGDIDWKAQYEHQKRRAERWIAKYEADIGPLEKAGPVAQQPQAEWIDGVPHWTPELIAKVKRMAAELDEPKQPQAEVGNSGFDHKTAADFLSGKTVSDEAVRKFVQAARWAHDDRASLQSTLLSVRNELASREAEIALLKKELMDAEEAPQQAEAVPPDVEVVRKALDRAFTMGQNYWADADSESIRANKRSDVTRAKFLEMREEVCAVIAAQGAKT